MKKIIFVLSLFVLMLFSSCTSNKQKEEAVNNAKTYIDQNQELLSFGTCNFIKTFPDSDKVKIEYKENGKIITNITSSSNVVEIHNVNYNISYDKYNVSGSFNITLYPTSFEDLTNIINAQFVNLNSSIDLITEYNSGLYEISYSSTNKEILDDDGNYHMPVGDVSFYMNYFINIKDLNIRKEFSTSINVKGYSEEEAQNILKEVEDYIILNQPTTIIDSTTLITSYPNNPNVSITWTENNQQRASIVQKGEKIVNTTYKYNIKCGSATKEGNINLKIYPKSFKAVANWFIAQVPTNLYESITYIEKSYLGIYNIAYESGDTSVLTNDGEYIKPTVDTPVLISYTITLADNKEYKYEGSFEITVIGVTDSEKVDYITKWLNNEVETELYIDHNIKMPKVDSTFEVPLVWTTSNSDVIDLEGNVTRFVYDRYVELTCKIVVGDFQNTVTFWMKVKAKDTSSMSMDDIINDFIKSIAVSEVKRVNFNINNDYQNITQSFNLLPFFDNAWKPQIEHIAPLSPANRPGTIKNKKFIVIHDTANNATGANGLAHAKYVEEGGGNTSFQYVVGNDGVYHLIPNYEVAYHAGDGTQYEYKLYDTGVKATSEKANLGISDDGYFTFNGVKSKIAIPADTVIKRICSSGIYYEVGENGNYWLNENYYNTTYEYIANRGGNNNSIGFETCVNQGSDYFKTVFFTANTVARLCIDNNFSVDQVLQHNNFSGKPCPNALRQTGFWQTFRDWVSMIKFGMQKFEGYSFEYISASDILSNAGYISRTTSTNTEVKYNIIVKDNQEKVVLSSTYTTKLIKF